MAESACAHISFWFMGKGGAKRSSDVDIAIESREDMSFLIGEFREALENSCIVYNVDVVDMNFAAESLCKKIREEGIVWKD